jgi:hypothetical protein
VTTSAEVEIIDPTRDDSWDVLTASHPENTIFHSSAWARVLIGTYGHKPFYLHLSTGHKTAAVLPFMEVTSPVTGRRGISLPFSDVAGPLFFTPVDPQLLVEQISRIARERRWKYVELRAGGALAPATLMPAFFGHTLDLTVGLERLRASLAGAVRRNLRKAEESALTIEISRKWEDLLKFYALHMRTRRRHGVPPQSVRFFSNIHEHLIKRGLGFVVVAALQSRRIAAAVFLRAGRKAVYKFGASDERFQLRRANNLVMWEGIKQLMDEGAHALHFGRTSTENEGLRRFKRGWGSKEESIVYSRLNPLTARWSTPAPESSGLHNQIFRTLPLPVNRLLGTLCYPHLD